MCETSKTYLHPLPLALYLIPFVNDWLNQHPHLPILSLCLNVHYSWLSSWITVVGSAFYFYHN